MTQGATLELPQASVAELKAQLAIVRSECAQVERDLAVKVRNGVITRIQADNRLKIWKGVVETIEKVKNLAEISEGMKTKENV